MAGRNIKPLRFNPRSVTDALDGGLVPEGGLAILQDLIFDPSNPFTFECRPAAVPHPAFTQNSDAFPAMGRISIAYVVGDLCYGMVAAGSVGDYDQPFAYDIENGVFYGVTGTLSTATLPVTQTPTGDWVPPTMDVVGILLVVTHPGFTGGSNAFFGWFDLTVPTSPVWNAGNTTTFPLNAVPSAVRQYNERAWLAVGNALWFTDSLTINVSSGNNILIIGDTTPITALSPQPLTTAVQGIIQSLAVFKSETIAQITGDDSTANLTVSIVSDAIGTDAPRTVVPITKGTFFVAEDGLRLLKQDGTISDPNPDLKIPFIYALTPSRASAAYNNNIYRVSVQNGHANGNPLEEYWFDVRQNGWTGPHSFTQDMAVAWRDSFVCFTGTSAPNLFTSDVVQKGSATYVENGQPMNFLMETSPLMDDGGLYENSAVLSVIDMELPTNGIAYNFAAMDVNHGVLSIVTVTAPTAGAIWDSVTWGDFIWTPVSYGLDRYNIPWTNNLVFSRMVIQAQGPSSFGFKIGKLTIGYQPLKYVRTP